jgi:acyl-CoA synthetase (AMP-forming)/AMP-acid ligase II/thioesterase domain-containing protein/acyl carrier protein
LSVRQPGVEAILAPDRAALSFGKLPQKLDAVRAALNRYGIGCGDLVAIALPKGPEMAVCFIGVASCAIAVPLNPDYADDEFARYLQRIKPKAIILPAGGADAARRQAAKLGIPVIDLAFDPAQAVGSFELLSDRRGDPARPGWNEAEDVGLILLTSGSTGKSKLVPDRQHHIAAYSREAAKMYRLGPGDRNLHIMPMFHGHGTKSSLLAPLLVGASVICPERFDVPSFFDNIARFRPTWYSAGYAIHHIILDQIEPYRAAARAAGLRFIRSGSGRLDPKIMQGLEDAFGAPVLERYGMSETCTLTHNPLPPATRKPGTVGIRCINEVRIIDDKGGFLGPNQEGEIVARGPTVIDGYWDDPEANAAAFVDGWFHTGDLGRFDDEGYLTITGRIKDLINRGGEKFSPVEIEKILCEHPRVAAACVCAIPHPTLGEEVVAAIVPVERGAVAELELLAHARARLIWFKVPRRILPCDALPKGDSGKVHRPSVAQMCLGMLTEANAAKATQPARMPSKVEREVLRLWDEVLETSTTDLDEDFFLAGGDSLKAAELLARIRRRLGVTLTLGQIFDDATTISGLARMIERARGARRTRRSLPSGLVPIKTDGDLPPLFAVPGSGGNPVGFVHLGRLLDRRRPLYGIESVGLDGNGEPIDLMEEIAAANIRRIKAFQPRGPYYLTGACFGGRVAYEMARQLAASGEQVAQLILLDASPPLTDAEGRPRAQASAKREASKAGLLARFMRDRVVLHTQSLVQLRGAERRAYLRQKLGIIGQMIRQRDPFRGDRSELIQRAVYEANRRAGRTYLPGPYAGPTILCFTRDRPIRGARNYREDWLTLVPQCGAPIQVAGKDSGDMLNIPHVYELADHFNVWLGAERRSDAPAKAALAKHLAAAQ